MIYEWDPQKNQQNIKDHGIDFETAIQVFTDVNGFEFYDDRHSSLKEERWKRIGRIYRGDVYMVVYTENEKSNIIRIITAFTDAKIESSYYERQKNK